MSERCVSYIYALACMSLTMAAMDNSPLPFTSDACRTPGTSVAEVPPRAAEPAHRSSGPAPSAAAKSIHLSAEVLSGNSWLALPTLGEESLAVQGA
jgi:hypothetical protein